ncbi:MAG: MaoC family dehydratase [Proteobacteria bacterium]|nr:MaoC family dehydratase [Pseudomonadota bacterium]
MSCKKSYSEIQIGDCAEFSKTITESDVYSYAGIVGDFNPMHIDAEAAKKGIFEARVAHGMLSAGLISTILGTKLPGPGTIFLGLELKFHAPVYFGDTLTAECEVTEKKDKNNILRLNAKVCNQDGKEVTTGIVTAMKKD